MVETVHDDLAHALRDLAARFGDTAFTDRRRLVSLLADRLPDARRDIKVVSAAVDERVFESLARARPEQLPLEIERLAAKLEAGHAIHPDIAIRVVQACAYSLSLGPLPSRTETVGQTAGAPAARPPAPAAGSSWVGMSEPRAAPARPRPWRRTPAVLAAIALALAGAGAATYVLSRRTAPLLAQAPPPLGQPPGAPMLRKGPPLPRIVATAAPHGHAVAFRFEDHAAIFSGSVIVPDDWILGSLVVWKGDDAASNGLRSKSDDGFDYDAASNTHSLHTTWTENDLGIHDFCVAFAHPPSTMNLAGSRICLAEAVGQDCRPIGCADVE